MPCLVMIEMRESSFVSTFLYTCSGSSCRSSASHACDDSPQCCRVRLRLRLPASNHALSHAGDIPYDMASHTAWQAHAMMHGSPIEARGGGGKHRQGVGNSATISNALRCALASAISPTTPSLLLSTFRFFEDAGAQSARTSWPTARLSALPSAGADHSESSPIDWLHASLQP